VSEAIREPFTFPSGVIESPYGVSGRRGGCMFTLRRSMRLRCMMIAGAVALAALAGKTLFRRAIEARALQVLKRRWGREASRRMLVTFREEHEALLEDGRKATGVMRFHLASARQGLALYRAMLKELGDGPEVVDAVHRVIWEAFLKPPYLVLGYMLGRLENPFEVFARSVDWVNKHVFPYPGWHGTVVEVEKGKGFDYSFCFYYDYLCEKGAPELTPAFCEIDNRQAEVFPEQIEFRRTQTLPAGGSRCDFRYYRREP
jgi:hypothetical protein